MVAGEPPAAPPPETSSMMAYVSPALGVYVPLAVMRAIVGWEEIATFKFPVNKEMSAIVLCIHELEVYVYDTDHGTDDRGSGRQGYHSGDRRNYHFDGHRGDNVPIE